MAADATPNPDSRISLKRQFALNAASGWVNQVVMVAIGFISLPYGIWRLGEQSYGIYQLGASALVFFGILQLGMGPTLVRYCAKAITEKDQEKIRQVSSTGLAMLGCLGVLSMILSLGSIPFFIHFYAIPQTLVWETTGLLVCMSVALFLRMISPAITGLLLGANRYDVSNAISSFGCIFRLLLIIAFFELVRPSIFFFGLAILLSQLTQVIFSFAFCLKFIGSDFLSFREIHFATFRSMLSFSSMNLINSIADTAAIQGPVLIIGKVLGEEMVTAFAPALVISAAMRGFLAQVSRPLVPLASREAKGQGSERFGQLSIKIGMVTAFIGFGIMIPFCVFGQELIGLWLGQDRVWIWYFVAVFATGTVITHIQDANYFLALGGGDIRAVVNSQVVVSFVICIGVTLGTLFLRWQLEEIAWFISICIFVRSAIYLAHSYSKQFSYSYAQCLRQVYGKPALVSMICIAFGQLVKNLFHPSNIVFLGLEVVLIGLVYAAIGWLFIFPRDVKKTILNVVPIKGLTSFWL